MSYTYTVQSVEDASDKLPSILEMIQKGLKGGPVVVTLGRKTRSKEQNNKLWPMLADVAGQVVWYGQQLSKEDWKHIFTASLTEQRVVPSLDGGFVVLGQSTRRMSREQLSQLIELIYAFGAERGVQWSEPSLEIYEQHREAV